MDQRMLETIIGAHLADPAVAWSLGSFGAVAEFMRKPDEPAEASRGWPLSLVTTRGAIGIRVEGDLASVAYTTPSRHEHRRHSGIAFCMPSDRSRMARRAVVTELGPDVSSLREEDRHTILFDVGLAQMQVDVCVRSGDPRVIERLRAACGRSIFDPAETLMRDMPDLSPHRVFISHAGRIEVFQGIPPMDGKSPDGPHTHVLPKLLAAERTHAANIPIPAGLVPCLYAHLSEPRDDSEDAHLTP